DWYCRIGIDGITEASTTRSRAARPQRGSTGADAAVPWGRHTTCIRWSKKGRLPAALRHQGVPSDRRIPRHCDLLISVAALFHVSVGRERIVEALDRDLFGSQHVVDFAPRLFGLIRDLIVEGMPTRIACEQERHMRDVGLHEYLAAARCDHMRRVRE